MFRPAHCHRRRVRPLIVAVATIVCAGFQGVTASAAQAASGTTASADPVVGPHALDERDAALRTTVTPSSAPAAPLSLRTPRIASASVSASAPASGPVKEVLGYAPYWMLSDWQEWRMWLLSTVAYFGITLDANGNIVNDSGLTGWNSSDLTNLVQWAHGAGDRVLVTVKCFDEASINGIVGNGSNINNAITNAINLAKQKGLDGVDVDFEGYSSSQYPNLRGQFVTFMGTMTSRVHAAIPNSEVVVDTYAGSAGDPQGMFDIAGLAPNVDAMYVMAYDMNPPGVTAATAPLNGSSTNDTSVVQQYVSQAGASKVILGVPYYGYKWSVTTPGESVPTTSNRAAVTYADSISDFSCASQLSYHWNATASTYWASWDSPAQNDPCGSNLNTWREAYYDDSSSLSAKYDLVNSSGIRGTGPWALGYDTGRSELWDTIGNKLNVGHNLGSGGATPVVAANTTPAGPAYAGVVGSDSALWVTNGGNSGFASWGGRLIAAPALARVPASGGGGVLLAVANGTNHGLWVRTSLTGWTPLAQYSWCQDNPAIAVSGPPGATILNVGCWGSDNGLWVAQTPVTTTGLPRVSGFTQYGGTLTAGPAVSWVAGIVTYLVTGSGGSVWTRSALAGWASTPWTCTGHPALAATDQTAYFACQGSDRGLWYAVNGGGGWGGSLAAGGGLVGGPGLAATSYGVMAFVEGLDKSVWERPLTPSGPLGTGYSADGGSVAGGGGTAAA